MFNCSCNSVHRAQLYYQGSLMSMTLVIGQAITQVIESPE
jgi:hypothetical protein